MTTTPGPQTHDYLLQHLQDIREAFTAAQRPKPATAGRRVAPDIHQHKA